MQSNLERLEGLQLLRIYFPKQYRRRVMSLSINTDMNYPVFMQDKRYIVYRAFSPLCLSYCQPVFFKKAFNAYEYALISTLNRKHLIETDHCDHEQCPYCSNRLGA